MRSLRLGSSTRFSHSNVTMGVAVALSLDLEGFRI